MGKTIVTKLKVFIMYEYIKKNNIKISDYIVLDKRYHLHKFIEDNFEYFSDFSINDILLEIDKYVGEKEQTCQEKNFTMVQ
ncbi:MAG: hypothetical protein IJ583_05850 [Firmicutes bacterium]|nr:hypothetical protein [Bacillota bacterium]